MSEKRTDGLVVDVLDDRGVPVRWVTANSAIKSRHQAAKRGWNRGFLVGAASTAVAIGLSRAIRHD